MSVVYSAVLRRRVKSPVNHNQLEILLVITNSPLLSVGAQSVDTVGTGQHHLSQPCSCVPTDYLLPPPSSLVQVQEREMG